MAPPRFPRPGHWVALAVAAFVAVSAAALWKAARHPFPLHWDEASYIDQAYEDAGRIRSGIGEGVRGFFDTGRDKPPAYRMMHQPVTLIWGVSPFTLRLTALLALAVTAGLAGAAAAAASGASAGILAALLVVLLPSVLSPSTQFGTEYPLFVAVAGMLWVMARVLYREGAGSPSGVLLGLFFGLGLLSKANFMVFAAPMLALWLAASFLDPGLRAARNVIVTGIGVGLAAAIPWWAVNVKPVYWQTRYASGFVRHAWPFDSWVLKGVTYVAFVCECGFGYPLAALGLVVAAGAYATRRADGAVLRDRRDRLMLGACLVSGGALLASQFLGRNQNARHAAPAFLAVAVALAVAAGRSGLVRRAGFAATVGAAVVAQVTLMLTGIPWDRPVDRLVGFIGDAPSNVFHVYDQWDWDALRSACLAHGVKRDVPRLAHLGTGFALNPPQIAFPWSRRHETVDVRVLWRYEEGDPDWTRLLDRAAGFDVVVTAPGFVGAKADKQDLDNRYNGDFAEMLGRDARFVRSEPLRLGASGQRVEVFFRRGSNPAPEPP